MAQLTFSDVVMAEIDKIKTEREKLALNPDKRHNNSMAAEKANDRQVGGNHYKTGEDLPQHWDLVSMYGWDYFQGQITKYLMRWRKKNGIEDLQKARHYLDKYIELESAKRDAAANASRTSAQVGVANQNADQGYGR